jgi:Gamma-glutamyl cyclotransferase, AIG2-like
MFAPVIRSVIGRVPECCPATISGYRRLEVLGELFPGLVRASSDAKVGGILYSNISDLEWERLTAFEDDFYELEQVSVLCPEGERLALAFIVPPSRRSILSEKSWDAEFFREQYLAPISSEPADSRSD